MLELVIKNIETIIIMAKNLREKINRVSERIENLRGEMITIKKSDWKL